MNNPKDNARSADGNWGKKIPSVAQDKASSKKKELAKKIKVTDKSPETHNFVPKWHNKGHSKKFGGN